MLKCSFGEAPTPFTVLPTSGVTAPCVAFTPAPWVPEGSDRTDRVPGQVTEMEP